MGVSIHAQANHNQDYYHSLRKALNLMWAKIRYPWFWFPPVRWIYGFDRKLDYYCNRCKDLTREVVSNRKIALGHPNFFIYHSFFISLFILNWQDICKFKIIALKKKDWEAYDHQPSFEELSTSGRKKLDFMDLLFSIRDEYGLTDEDIRGQVDMFMAAGFNHLYGHFLYSNRIVIFFFNWRYQNRTKSIEKLK